MVKKIMIVAVILFIAYSIFLKSFAPEWWHASQHQWQGNMINAQKFMYDKSSMKNVIVGSSLSNRLIMDSLPQTYNLSFSGQSILDGLNILTHKTLLPGNVFIEMNVILKEEDKTFTGSLSSPILFYPRKILPSLREDKQPAAVIGSLLEEKFTRRFIEKIRNTLRISNSSLENKTDSGLFLRLLKLKIDNYSTVPDSTLLNKNFTSLKIYVSDLERKGVNIIFFEMPVNSQLNNMLRPRMIRAVFHKNYPDTKYTYIPFPIDIVYKTSDALHLSGEEALHYTIYLKKNMQKYLE